MEYQRYEVEILVENIKDFDSVEYLLYDKLSEKHEITHSNERNEYNQVTYCIFIDLNTETTHQTEHNKIVALIHKVSKKVKITTDWTKLDKRIDRYID